MNRQDKTRPRRATTAASAVGGRRFTRLWLAPPALVLWATLVPGCGEVAREPDPHADETRALLGSVGKTVIFSSYRRFHGAADELVAATRSLSTALSRGRDVEAARRTARAAWRTAMELWQRAELMQIGPAAAKAKDPGGQDLRDEIYSWPTVSPCRIDQELVAKSYAKTDFFDNTLVDAYGLDALEYLLFHDASDNSCSAQAEINQGGWSALRSSERAQRRADYAVAVAGKLAEDAAKLVSTWDPARGNFVHQLATAGRDGSVYGSAQAALDRLFAAMFYLDATVKDVKLGGPLGLTAPCGARCADKRESRWADHSRENVLANLRGFEELYLGGPPKADKSGFDDLLERRGAAHLAAGLRADSHAAVERVAGYDTTLKASLADDPQPAKMSYAAIKKITDKLETEFSKTLGLTVPQQADGDHD